MYAENELLFPFRIVFHLQHVQNNAWRSLAEKVACLPENHPESLAFCLMMIRLNGCLKCETDCYRAMRGCLACTRQTLHRLRIGEAELRQRYEAALKTVNHYLTPQPQIRRRSEPRLQAQAA